MPPALTGGVGAGPEGREVQWSGHQGSACAWQVGKNSETHSFAMTPQPIRPPAPPIGWVM